MKNTTAVARFFFFNTPFIGEIAGCAWLIVEDRSHCNRHPKNYISASFRAKSPWASLMGQTDLGYAHACEEEDKEILAAARLSSPVGKRELWSHSWHLSGSHWQCHSNLLAFFFSTILLPVDASHLTFPSMLLYMLCYRDLGHRSIQPHSKFLLRVSPCYYILSAFGVEFVARA